jgi:hypothetical protein
VLEVVGDQVVNGMPGRRRGSGEHGRGLLEVALELGLRRVVLSRVPAASGLLLDCLEFPCVSPESLL